MNKNVVNVFMLQHNVAVLSHFLYHVLDGSCDAAWKVNPVCLLPYTVSLHLVSRAIAFYMYLHSFLPSFLPSPSTTIS